MSPAFVRCTNVANIGTCEITGQEPTWKKHWAMVMITSHYCSKKHPNYIHLNRVSLYIYITSISQLPPNYIPMLSSFSDYPSEHLIKSSSKTSIMRSTGIIIMMLPFIHWYILILIILTPQNIIIYVYTYIHIYIFPLKAGFWPAVATFGFATRWLERVGGLGWALLASKGFKQKDQPKMKV